MSEIERKVIEWNSETFTWGSYNDISILIRDSDGYVNVTKLSETKRVRKYFESDKWREIVEYWMKIPHIGVQSNDTNSKNIPMSHYLLNESIPDNKKELRGTYVHPELIHFIAEWVSVEYAFKVSYVMNSINELYHVKNTSFDNERKNILDNIKNDISKCTNSQQVGKIGEDYVFNYLKSRIPDLINVRTEPFACDFYSEKFNIRFEVKTTEDIDNRTYAKLKRDVELRNPNLTVFISNRCKIIPHLKLCPNILFINFEDLNDTMFDLILHSAWNTSEKIMEELKCDRLNVCIDKLEQMMNNNNNTNTLTPSSVKPTVIEDEMSEIIKNKMNELKTEIASTAITHAKKSIDNDINDEKIFSVEKFIDTNKDQFIKGYNIHHIKENYRKFCKENSLICADNGNTFNTIMRDYCFHLILPEHMRPNKTDKYIYVLKNNSEHMKNLNEYVKVMGKDKLRECSNKTQRYNDYVNWCEKTNILLRMTKQSFNYEIDNILY